MMDLDSTSSVGAATACVLLLSSALAAGCGLEQEPLQKDGTANNGVVTNNGAGDAARPDLPLSGDEWEVWGTVGSTDLRGKSPGGSAMCSADDIRTDDLGTDGAIDTPTGPWAGPERDAQGRCGSATETASWRLMNCERLSKGLAPLACDLRFVWIGRAHSRDMGVNMYFAHDSLNGDTPFDRMEGAGLSWSSAAENVGQGAEWQAVHFGWMDSMNHRGHILDAGFSETGVGMFSDGNRILLTTGFIQP